MMTFSLKFIKDISTKAKKSFSEKIKSSFKIEKKV